MLCVVCCRQGDPALSAPVWQRVVCCVLQARRSCPIYPSLTACCVLCVAGKEILPYLPQLMQYLLTSVRTSSSLHAKALAISAIGATGTNSRPNTPLIPHAPPLPTPSSTPLLTPVCGSSVNSGTRSEWLWSCKGKTHPAIAESRRIKLVQACRNVNVK